ncbi:hypothetical protein PAERUG_E16_London_17_VIM_2_04_14_03798 [Pseudomonas aeruginosa]|nr:hypothetical protein PAERUG_E16_London_17_VIM_2_04_14_03798 [Pseudomonas aeruginosa]
MLVLREYLRSQLAELGIAEQRRILPYVVASFVRMGGGWTGRALLVGREALLALLVAMHLVLHHFGQPGFRLPSGQQMRPPLLRVGAAQIDGLHEVLAVLRTGEHLHALARGPLQLRIGHVQDAGTGKDQLGLADRAAAYVGANLGVLPQQLVDSALVDAVFVQLSGSAVDHVEIAIAHQPQTQRPAFQGERHRQLGARIDAFGQTVAQRQQLHLGVHQRTGAARRTTIAGRGFVCRQVGAVSPGCGLRSHECILSVSAARRSASSAAAATRCAGDWLEGPSSSTAMSACASSASSPR